MTPTRSPAPTPRSRRKPATRFARRRARRRSARCPDGSTTRDRDPDRGRAAPRDSRRGWTRQCSWPSFGSASARASRRPASAMSSMRSKFSMPVSCASSSMPNSFSTKLTRPASPSNRACRSSAAACRPCRFSIDSPGRYGLTDELPQRFLHVRLVDAHCAPRLPIAGSIRQLPGLPPRQHVQPLADRRRLPQRPQRHDEAERAGDLQRRGGPDSARSRPLRRAAARCSISRLTITSAPRMAQNSVSGHVNRKSPRSQNHWYECRSPGHQEHRRGGDDLGAASRRACAAGSTRGSRPASP